MYVCMYYFALVTLLSDHIISTTKLPSMKTVISFPEIQ